MELELERVDEIVEKNKEEAQKKSPLIPVLQDIQKTYGWLPEEAMKRAARKLGVSLASLSGVASFYNEFRIKPLV